MNQSDGSEQCTSESNDEPIQHTSRAAVLAAMFALPVCCPPMSIVACILGGFAYWSIGRTPSLKGRWLAMTAMVVGAASAGIMSWLLWTSGLGTLWAGPTPPLHAVMQASPEQIREHWAGPATLLSESQLKTCATALHNRYGDFHSAHPSLTRTTPLAQASRNPVVTIPISITFSNNIIEADLGLQRFDELSGQVVMKWRVLRVMDATNGDFVFPPGEPPPPALDSPTNSPQSQSAPAALPPPQSTSPPSAG